MVQHRALQATRERHAPHDLGRAGALLELQSVHASVGPMRRDRKRLRDPLWEPSGPTGGDRLSETDLRMKRARVSRRHGSTRYVAARRSSVARTDRTERRDRIRVPAGLGQPIHRKMNGGRIRRIMELIALTRRPLMGLGKACVPRPVQPALATHARKWLRRRGRRWTESLARNARAHEKDRTSPAFVPARGGRDRRSDAAAGNGLYPEPAASATAPEVRVRRHSSSAARTSSVSSCRRARFGLAGGPNRPDHRASAGSRC